MIEQISLPSFSCNKWLVLWAFRLSMHGHCDFSKQIYFQCWLTTQNLVAMFGSKVVMQYRI